VVTDVSEPGLDELRSAAAAWADHDPDESTAAALRASVTTGDRVELLAAMGGAIAFGTAGLRGEVGPGSARMNRATVLRATAGLAAHLAATADPELPVCVGYDARPDSRRFASDVVGVLLAAGRRVVAYGAVAPTPLVAWAARETGAAGAVVVTASHNPPADNGYKVYDGSAKQIVPPTDAAIADRIAAAPPADRVPTVDHGWDHPQLEMLGPFARGRYLDQAVELVHGDEERADLRVVHTALHGVGGDLVVEVLHRTGATDVHPVPEQAMPDGTFPTVAFPNPEEPGALDLATALADEVGADLVVANDPDADRLAVAVPAASGWRRLHGNEVAVLLAEDLLARGDAARPLVATSIVTSPWVAQVAGHHGARAEQTLTGFKWIWACLLELEEAGWDPVLGAEEALGYSIGTVVRDKDGISAAAVLVDLARRLAARGSTLEDELARLRTRDGAWVAAQVSAVRPGAAGRDEIAAAMGAARSAPPVVLAGRTVVSVVDHAVDDGNRAPWLPTADLVEVRFDDGRAMLRPSGTEPKLKAYVDLRLPADTPGDRARALAEAVAEDWLGGLGLRD
jgi:phosphomannomutase